jgi:large subunit ribosomal protein L25
MSEYGNITAKVRTGRGKGAARRLRAKGLIPAVLYGQGKDNLALSISPAEFNKATDPEKRVNTLFSLTITEEGKADVKADAVVSELQRDAIRSDLMHIDFMRVDPSKDIVRKVPVRYHGRSIGVTKGGKLRTFLRHIDVAAKPENIPVELAIDVTPIDAGQAVRIRDVSIPDARILARPESPVAIVELPKAKQEEEEGAPAAAAD